MNKLLAVTEKLKSVFKIPEIVNENSDGISASWIKWTEENNDACKIYEDDIAVENEKLAWFQSSENDNYLLVIYENNKIFRWIPETHNPIFGCICLLLEWFEDHLIFIYQEKHYIYICSISNEKVRHFKFHGAEIERKGNLISYELYQGKLADKVRLIRIPDLTEIEPIDKKEAERIGLLPNGLNRPGNFLALK